MIQQRVKTDDVGRQREDVSEQSPGGGQSRWEAAQKESLRSRAGPRVREDERAGRVRERSTDKSPLTASISLVQSEKSIKSEEQKRDAGSLRRGAEVKCAGTASRGSRLSRELWTKFKARPQGKAACLFPATFSCSGSGITQAEFNLTN